MLSIPRAAGSKYIMLPNPDGERRELGQHESFFYVGQEVFGSLDVMVSRVTVQVPKAVVLTNESVIAMHKQVTRRHPMLRSRITKPSECKQQFLEVQDIDAISAYTTSPPAVLFGPLGEAGELIIQRLMASELQRGFDFNQPPLWRLSVAPHVNGNLVTFVFAVEHTIGDGISCVSITQDVLQLFHASTGGGPLREPLTLLPSCSELLSGKPEQVESNTSPRGPAVHHLPVLGSTVSGDATTARESLAPRQLWVSRSLSADDVVRLAAACRARGTTVTGALTAAIIQALRASFGEGQWIPSTASHFGPKSASEGLDNHGQPDETEGTGRAFQCFFPVSLRGQYAKPIGNEHVGFHFGGVNTWWACEAASRPSGTPSKRLKAGAPHLDWALAIEARTRLKAGIELGEPLHMTSKPMSDAALRDSLLAASSVNCGRTKALTVSNRGSFELPATLIAYQHTTNIAPLGPTFQLSCVTLNGIFYMTLATVSPAVDAATATKVADGTIAYLKEAATHD